MGSGLTFLLVLVLVALILVVMYLTTWRRPRRFGRPIGPSSNGNTGGKVSDLGPDQDLRLLKSGDVLALWSGEELLVEQALEARENLAGKFVEWRWLFLEGGRLLALAPVGNVLYSASTVFYQGGEPYQRLTGEVEDGGVLKVFEARVREGTIGTNPVTFEHEQQSFRMTSTGTFAITGQTPPDSEVWRDVQPVESENVYFKMSGPDGMQALGVWTSHIAFLTGRALSTTDVREVYRTGR